MKLKSFIVGFTVGVLVFVLGAYSASAVKNYGKTFDDVHEDDWFYAPVMELSEKGIVNGYEDGTFGSTNYISRAETAKLIYGLENRISRLENEVGIESGNSSATLVDDTLTDDSLSADESDVESVGSDIKDKLVLYFNVNLDTEKPLNVNFDLFKEGTKKFQVQYPSKYFWNNTYGEKDENDEYLWYTTFGLAEFDDLEGIELEANEKIILSIVNTKDVQSDRDVNIFVPIEGDNSFLIEGDMFELNILEKMAMSLAWTQDEPATNTDDTSI